MKCLLHTIIIAALWCSALLRPALRLERPLLLALNPQPEPPGKRRSSGSMSSRTTRGGRSRRSKQKPDVGTPATRY
jgi:hypothetical protein